MPRKFKDRMGFTQTDLRETLEEWVKRIGGRFASLISAEIRGEGESEKLWAQVRTSTNWDPEWMEVDPEVILTMPQYCKFKP